MSLQNQASKVAPIAAERVDTVLGRIKVHTESSHLKIESRLAFLMSPDLSHGELGQLLSRFYTFLVPQEARLSAIDRLQQDPWLTELSYPARIRAPAILHDLITLGFAQREIADFSWCKDLPPLETPAQRLGFLYVIEGSSLGGRIISNHLSKTLGLQGTTAMHYFSIYGAETGPRWKAFTETLKRFVQAHPAQEKNLCNSAHESFERLTEWVAPR
ncbi:MAG: biliverdin-producing heme oxygenase [Methylotenera sp.]|nr:biliverdin-producing heme oxygenase [Oligoflexia bacterium]